MHSVHPTAAEPTALVRAGLVLLLCTLCGDAAGLDLWVMRQIGTGAGFPWRHHPLLETVLHDGGRQLAILAYLLLWGWLLWPASSGPSRSERGTVLALVTLSLVTVGLLKQASRASCPWEWSAFGGPAVYTSHWNLLTGDGGAGRCFPGGHASSALSFLALSLPWLWSPVAGRRPAPGRRWLFAVLLAGLVAGVTQTLRGAHPPSHTLWTLVICGTIALAGWRMALPWLLGNAVQRPVTP
jgi:membrane-associated PAP2 superfamily phosphatase